MLAQRALEALFPRFCAVCKREGAFLCTPCLEFWTPAPAPVSCPFCDTQGSARTCFDCKGETYLDGLSSFLPYGNPALRTLIASWKYHGDRDVEEVLKRLLAQAVLYMQPPLRPYVAVPLSLHVARRRYRGFDQAEVIADWVEELYGIPSDVLIQRVSRTTPQARRGHAQRKVGEMDGVFKVIQPSVPGAVLLCDDVFTSGATMDAAARVLKEGGASFVWGFVLGRG